MTPEDNPAIAAILKQFKGRIVGVRNTARVTPRIPQTIETTIATKDYILKGVNIMAAHETDDHKGHGNFFSIKHNSIVQESKEEQQGWEKVTGTVASTGEPFTKWIKRYAALDGFIDSIEWYSREYNGTKFMGLHVKVNDGSYRAILDLAFNTRSYDAFTKFAANIDFTQPVVLKAFLGRDDKVAFFATQNGVTVPRKHSKDNLNGMPEARQTRTGKLDYSEQQDWLLDQIITEIAPRCAAAAKERGVQPFETDDRQFADEAAGENGKAASVPKASGAPAKKNTPDDPYGDDFDRIPNGTAPPDNKGRELDTIPF